MNKIRIGIGFVLMLIVIAIVIGIIFFIYWLLGISQVLIWKGAIPYKISNDFTVDEKNIILLQMNKITEASGGLKFIPKTNHVEFINFEKTNLGDGSVGEITCGESLISKRFGGQTITLHPKCINSKTILHELLHALGFNHEHTRPDRDNFIQIKDYNISENCKSQFETYKKENRIWKEIVSKTPYDYNSIMHYNNNVCSKVSYTTVFKAKQGNVIQFGSDELSEIDKQRLQMYYRKYK